MNKNRLGMLRHLRESYQDIIASREELAIKRAISDGHLTLVLSELAVFLPAEERILIEEMIHHHNRLWSSTLRASLARMREAADS